MVPVEVEQAILGRDGIAVTRPGKVKKRRVTMHLFGLERRRCEEAT